MQESLNERVRALVREAQGREGTEGVSLLGRAAAGSTPNHRDSLTSVRFRLRVRLKFAEEVRPEPEFEHAVPDRVQGGVFPRVTEVGQAREDPVDPLPLVVHLPRGSRFAELVTPGEEGPDLRSEERRVGKECRARW